MPRDVATTLRYCADVALAIGSQNYCHLACLPAKALVAGVSGRFRPFPERNR